MSVRCRLRYALIAFVSFSGCRDTVVTDLSQRQALEVAAFLSSRGIDGEIAALRQGVRARYAVRTESSVTKDAVVALAAAELPSSEPVTSDDLLMMNSGMIPPSSFVERHRMDRVLAAQLEEQLKVLPGVVTVRAVLRLHTVDLVGRTAEGNNPEPQLSIVVKVREGSITREHLLGIARRVVPELSEKEMGVVLVTDEVVSKVESEERYKKKEEVLSKSASG